MRSGAKRLPPIRNYARHFAKRQKLLGSLMTKFRCFIQRMFLSAIIFAMAWSKALAASNQEKTFWQLTLAYTDQDLSLVRAKPISASPKKSFLTVNDSATLQLGYLAEWLDQSGNIIQSEQTAIPLGARSAFPIAGKSEGHEEFIPSDGAFTIRIPGPKPATTVARIRLIKRPASTSSATAAKLIPPTTFGSTVSELPLPKLSDKDGESNFAADFHRKLTKDSNITILGGPTAVSKIHDTGPDTNRLVMVVVGDGFTASDLAAGKFANQVNRFFEHFFNTSPWNVLSNAVNVYQIDVVSNESGADYEDAPPSNGGTLKDTYFDTTFWAGGVERCLYLGGNGIARATAAADSFIGPGVWDNILIFVNSEKYGGCGGAVGVSSLNASADEIQIHEFGHSFAQLADEYEHGSPGTNCLDSPLPNVDCEFNLPGLKWAQWIEAGTPLPTPESFEYSGVVGAFQGGLYQSAGIFRPTLDCRMRTLGREFCPVCKESHVLKLLEKLDLLGGAIPSESTVELTTNWVRSFSVDHLNFPGIQYQWYLDGISMPGETNPVVFLSSIGFPPHPGSLELMATFSTPLVRGREFQDVHTWSVSFAQMPTLLSSSSNVWEGDTATNEIQIPVSLSSPSGANITLHFATADGTARAGEDYESQSGDLIFAPGETTKVLHLIVHGDRVPEPEEKFSVLFSNAVGTQFQTNSISITILDDDNPPMITIATPANGAQFSEGDAIEITALPVSGQIAAVDFYSDGQPLATILKSPYSTYWTNASVGAHLLTARVTDFSGDTSTTDQIEINITPRGQEFALIPINGFWKYDATTNELAATWMESQFDDSPWSGPSKALFSSSNRGTIGTINTLVPETYNGAAVRTILFRSHFDFPVVPNFGTTLIASNLLSHGAIFHLNGTEVGRMRMPSGPVTRDQAALGGGWVTNYDVLSFDPASLNQGDNVMAVELHLSSNANFPATFGMSLTAKVGINPMLTRQAKAGAKWHVGELAKTSTTSSGFTISSIDPFSARGASLSTNENWIFYLPPQGLTNLDSFKFTLRDPAGGSIPGVATIVTTSKIDSEGSVTVVTKNGGALEIEGDGIPKSVYTIEFRESPDAGIWQRLGEVTADENGLYSLLDNPNPGTPRFYRAVPK